MNDFKTIDDLINELKEYKQTFGNIPILLSFMDANEKVLCPLISAFHCTITHKPSKESQDVIILADYQLNNNDSEE